jgi:hypothetical protein
MGSTSAPKDCMTAVAAAAVAGDGLSAEPPRSARDPARSCSACLRASFTRNTKASCVDITGGGVKPTSLKSARASSSAIMPLGVRIIPSGSGGSSPPDVFVAKKAAALVTMDHRCWLLLLLLLFFLGSGLWIRAATGEGLAKVARLLTAKEGRCLTLHGAEEEAATMRFLCCGARADTERTKRVTEDASTARIKECTSRFLEIFFCRCHRKMEIRRTAKPPEETACV